MSAQPPRETIRAAAGALGEWFHNIDLGGVRTAPDHFLGDYPAVKWRAFAHAVPADLSGKTVLDIGCNGGFYSFELAARGASVLAVDVDEHYLRQARWAAQQLDPDRRVELRRMSVYSLADLDERFDVVLFLGVLYHLRHPLLALDIVAERVGSRMLLQTLTMPGEAPAEAPEDLPISERGALAGPGWPRAAFIERNLAGDPTNWWAPDDAGVRAMVRSAGMRVTAAPAHEIYVCEPDPDHDPARAFRVAELDAVLRRGAPQSSSRKRK